MTGRWLARCTFPAPGSVVTCGVSGGADSLALLVLAGAAGLVVTAHHVDHGLRPDSVRADGLSEAEVVADAAARVGAAFRSSRVEVAPGGDLEARARRARHGALGPEALLGHTADDQAETVLLALLRGAGIDGVAAMDGHRHPILDLRRADTEAVCAAAGLDPVLDPSNADPRFRRNRVRAEVLPLLADVADRDPVPLLCRTAQLARADVALLDSLAAALDPTDAGALVAAPPALARRAVRAWLRPAMPDGQPPDLASVERVLAVAAGDAVGTEVPGGVRVRRTAGQLRLEPPSPSPDHHRRGVDG